MNRHTHIWKFMTLCAALVAAALVFPQPIDAQRAVRRGGGGQDRGGASAPAPSSPRGGGGASGGERRAAPPQRVSPQPQAAAPQDHTSTRAGDQTRPSDNREGDAGGVRRRGDNPQAGVAVARHNIPRSNRGAIILPGGWYPWGWGGYGFARYYGYGFYDPWFDGGYGYGGRYFARRDDGSVRLKVKPREASVLVDGYYAGTVDDFDGIFQSLPLEPGPHRIEMQLDGYSPLTFDVRVLPERKTTFEGTLDPLAP